MYIEILAAILTAYLVRWVFIAVVKTLREK